MADHVGWFRENYYNRRFDGLRAADLIQVDAKRFINRVWDTVAVGFVRWTTSSPDAAGASYPGPGVFGVNTSDYCVEAVL